MNLVDLLLRLSIPLWLALLLAAAAILAVIFYRHLLERRIKQLEYRLQEKAASQEKTLELLLDRHREKLKALHEINRAMMAFDHGVEHLRAGNSDRAILLRRGYEEARDLSRKYEDLLGDEFYLVVRNYTDQGERILRSSFVVTSETLTKLEERRFEPSTWNGLKGLIGQRVPVSEAKARLRDLNVMVGLDPRRSVANFFDIVGEFDADDYQEAKTRYRNVKQEVLHTLPRLPPQSVA